MPDTKRCTKCGEAKLLSNFPKKRPDKDWLCGSCKVCKNKRDAELKAIWRKNNKIDPEKLRIYRKTSHINRRSTSRGKINESCSCAIRRSFKKGVKANRHWEELVGYTVEQLKTHLEKKFKPGMTWMNYGSYWQIDHKIPLSAFNFERPEDLDFKRCWSLKNLQPLEATTNMKKYINIDKPFQPSLAI